ncbi:hypothetical protein DXG03_009048 [Asterophora parasitica]|uniref:Uncharacterized protein n=1 Tax=Asterophora parasitica TaxID=117018 RepID=A0A9P7G5W9_9AGAR|nr:hypothetical protein DXG03_009048 [Asterophora parasitica]
MTKPRQIPPRRRSLSDPLAAALLPPPNESPIQREVRLKAETEARKVSEGIDEIIRRERIQRKKAKSEVNVLLLGQSESGKSTTLKQFQLVHTPATFRAERMAWRTVIYLNLVRSITRILDALSPEVDNVDDHDDADSLETATLIITSSGRPPSAISGTRVPNYESYRSRLVPLIDLEDRLTRLLSSPHEDEPTHLPQYPNREMNGSSNGNGFGYPKFSAGSSIGHRPAPTISIPKANTFSSSPVSPIGGNGAFLSPSSSSGSSTKTKGREVSVHASASWKRSFTFGGGKSKSPKTPNSGEIEGWWEDPDDPVHALNACAPTMQELWRDPRVRERLREKRIRLEESSGFYLDDISRITAKKYFPTDCALIHTLGLLTPQTADGRHAPQRMSSKLGSRLRVLLSTLSLSHLDIRTKGSSGGFTMSVEPETNDRPGLRTSKMVRSISLAHGLALFDGALIVRNERDASGYTRSPKLSIDFRLKFGAMHQTYTPNKERELYS